MNIRCWKYTGLLACLIAGGVAAQDVARLEACRATADSLERLRCYDKVMDERTDRPAAASQRPAAAPTPAAPAPAAAPATSAAPAANPFAPPKRDEVPEKITATLEKATRSVRGQMILYTDAGIWEQSDDRKVLTLPAPGAKVEVRRGALGSFFCQPDNGTSVRCRQRTN